MENRKTIASFLKTLLSLILPSEPMGHLLCRSGSEESASRQVTPQQHPEPNTRLGNINNNNTNNNIMWVVDRERQSSSLYIIII